VKTAEHRARKKKKKIEKYFFFLLQTLIVGDFTSNHLTTFSQHAGAYLAHHWEKVNSSVVLLKCGLLKAP
jgi:hypothetical protein